MAERNAEALIAAAMGRKIEKEKEVKAQTTQKVVDRIQAVNQNEERLTDGLKEIDQVEEENKKLEEFVREHPDLALPDSDIVLAIATNSERIGELRKEIAPYDQNSLEGVDSVVSSELIKNEEIIEKKLEKVKELESFLTSIDLKITPYSGAKSNLKDDREVGVANSQGKYGQEALFYKTWHFLDDIKRGLTQLSPAERKRVATALNSTLDGKIQQIQKQVINFDSEQLKQKEFATGFEQKKKIGGQSLDDHIRAYLGEELYQSYCGSPNGIEVWSNITGAAKEGDAKLKSINEDIDFRNGIISRIEDILKIKGSVFGTSTKNKRIKELEDYHRIPDASKFGRWMTTLDGNGYKFPKVEAHYEGYAQQIKDLGWPLKDEKSTEEYCNILLEEQNKRLEVTKQVKDFLEFHIAREKDVGQNIEQKNLVWMRYADYLQSEIKP